MLRCWIRLANEEHQFDSDAFGSFGFTPQAPHKSGTGMSDNLFSRSFLLSSWAKEYAAYCASGEDAVLLTKLQHWAERANHKETSAEKAFIQTFFVDVFGYSTAGTQAKADGYNLFPQFPVAKAGQGGGTGEADLAIGWFGLADIPQTPQALCEFKDDRSGLDAAQNRKGNDRSRLTRSR